MTIVKCAIDGCASQFTTVEEVAVDVRFICKNHPRAVQVRAANRPYDAEKDNADGEVHFDEYQFDPRFRKAKKRGLIKTQNQESQ